MRQYKVYTDKGSFKIEAQNDMDALRISLYYCWRDSEKFRHIEAIGVNPHYTIHASIILNNSFFTFEQ